MTETARTVTQYLTFSLGKELFGIDVIKTREILDLIPVTRVPQMPDDMLGVINLRGRVVPVIELSAKFGMGRRERTVDSCIIVMEVQVEEAAVIIGVLVDSVREVIDLEAGQIEPPPRLGTRLNTAFIQGMGHCQDNFVILLDIDRVFSSNELALVKDVALTEQSEAATELLEA
jgi:purine-binding chemotaxis protein CheW